MAKGEIFCVFEHFHDNTLEKKKLNLNVLLSLSPIPFSSL